jgi:arabinose-5-phosphate isomerase
MNNSLKNIAREVIETEADCLLKLVQFINDDFVAAVEAIHASSGQVVACGIGKSAIIARKFVATLNSTGHSSMFLHAGDAVHGDAGMIRKDDIVIIFSNSGETPEAIAVASQVKSYGNQMIAMVSKPDSTVARLTDYLLCIPENGEADADNLVPTNSTIVQMALSDAVAICLMKLKGFTKEQFASFHPGGNLGKRLFLKTLDLCQYNTAPSVLLEDNLATIIASISKGKSGATAVTDSNGMLKGVITDGDLRRMLLDQKDTAHLVATDIMTPSPKCIESDTFAIEAVAIAQQNNISQVLVVSEGKYIGIIHLHDLIREGLV